MERRMRLVRLWLVCTCAAVLFLPAHVTSWGRQNAGEAWAQSFGGSLDGQPGARENALGGAGVALIGDPSDAVWWNPAALGFARTASGQVTHGFANEQSPWPLSTRDDNASGAIPLGSLGGIGFCLTDLSYPSYHSQIDYSYFRPSYLSRGGSVGLHFFSNLAVGATVKWIQIELRPYDIVSETFGADLGALYRVPLDRGSLSFGMNVQNLGPDVTLHGEDEKRPLNRKLKVGAAIDLPTRLGDRFVVGGIAVLDFNQPLVTDEFRTWNGGVEGYAGYSNFARLALRVGYYDDRLQDSSDLTFGLGARVMGLTIDAAWVPQAFASEKDRVLKLTAGLHFGKRPMPA